LECIKGTGGELFNLPKQRLRIPEPTYVVFQDEGEVRTDLLGALPGTYMALPASDSRGDLATGFNLLLLKLIRGNCRHNVKFKPDQAGLSPRELKSIVPVLKIDQECR
jgi:hypothetical protein